MTDPSRARAAADARSEAIAARAAAVSRTRTERGLHELVADVSSSPLYNKDLAPTGIDHRTWGTYHIASLWVGLSVCIPTYMLASGLISGGMSWSQAILTIALGNAIVLAPMILNAHAGTKYGVPFPVLARAAFGPIGSNVPALLRAVVACGWFGIQTWIGGAAIHAMLKIIAPGWEPPGAEWIAFAAFWLLNIAICVRGPESIKALEALSAPFLIVVGLGLLWWAVNAAGGFGPILSQPSRFTTTADFLRFFVPSLTAMVGYWATLALNIPDFTRFAKGQREQMLGQALGLPTTMTLYAFIGVVVTSATVVIFGETIWDPVALLARFSDPIVAFVSLVALAIATLTTNIAANVVSPANDLANVWPRKIDFARGSIITGVIGVLMMPWKLLEDFGAYIFGWLIGYSGFLGTIAGVLIADYYIVRRRNLSLYDLYVRGGIYEYRGGVNGLALVALGGGIATAFVGLVVPALRFLYDYAWFVGFLVAFALTLVLARRPSWAATAATGAAAEPAGSAAGR
jgi:NCS1 family nucleobase:cation symporter-1